MKSKICATNSFIVGRKAKLILLSLLVLLNLVLRIPSIPHEKGYDSFFIHSLANSISIFGDAQWWINWLSVFGFYAYSYASAVPFILSAIHQLTSMEMELAILLYCVITGILSIFTAYILAGRIFPDFLFRFGVALFFSIAPGVMLFSTWEVSTRGIFIILLPLFIYLLLSDIKLGKKALLICLLLTFQFSVHHYGFILLPIIMVFVTFKLLEKTPYFNLINSKSHYFILLLSFVLLGLPFVSRSLVDSGSRYSWLITSSVTILRQTGPMLMLALGGYFFTLFKKGRSLKELYLLCILTMFIPVIYSHAYGAYILLLFIILFIGIAFFNVTKVTSHKKMISFCLIAFIIMSVAFSGFFNHNRTGGSSEFWYMDDETYVAGMWGRIHVPDNSYGLDTAFETGRMFAVSEGHPITPSLGAGNLAYGFLNESDIEYVQHSYLESAFYFEGPYTAKSGTTVAGKLEWLRQATTTIGELEDFEYFVQDRYYAKPVTGVVTQYYNKVYDNPRLVIWQYNHEK